MRRTHRGGHAPLDDFEDSVKPHQTEGDNERAQEKEPQLTPLHGANVLVNEGRAPLAAAAANIAAEAGQTHKRFEESHGLSPAAKMAMTKRTAPMAAMAPAALAAMLPARLPIRLRIGFNDRLLYPVRKVG